MSHFWFKLLVISVLLASESDCCLKRFKEIKRKIKAKFGKQPAAQNELIGQEQPAILDRDPNSIYPKYSQNQFSGLFFDVEEEEDGSYKIVGKIPPILSQKLIINETVVAEPLLNETNFLNYTNDFENENDTDITAIGYNETIITDSLSISETEVNSEKGENPPAVEEEKEILSPEDVVVRFEWGGECKDRDWKKCSKLRRLFLPYHFGNLTGYGKQDPTIIHWIDIDCLVEKVFCLCNGWTVNRCQLMCMSKCNREMQALWDVFVVHEGPCPLSQTPRKMDGKNPCEAKAKNVVRHEFG